MKILLFIDRLGSGGAQTQISLLARELAALGHSVELVTYHNSDLLGLGEYYRDVKLKQIGCGGRLSILMELLLLIRSSDFDAVVGFLAVPSFYLLLGCIGAQFKGVVIVGERASFRGKMPTLRDRALRMPLSRANAVVANSHAHAADLRKYFSSVAPKVHAIVNGVDLVRFRPGQLDGSIFQVAAVGRVVRDKDILTLVRAVARLLSEEAALRLRVCWYGRAHDPVYRDECDRLIQTHLPPGVWQWGGEVSDVSEVLRQSDLLVHTSQHEGCPNAVCEALASGTPCLMTRVGDANWLIGEAGQRGAVFPLGDAESLAAALLRFISMPAEQKIEIRQNCRRFAELELAPSEMAMKYVTVIKKEASRD